MLLNRERAQVYLRAFDSARKDFATLEGLGLAGMLELVEKCQVKGARDIVP